ncbi:MAG: AAA-like domain-containing protein, partial [Rivularia sp. (in: cyanobacteria)]
MISVKQGNEYQLGGSLPEEAPSYVVRKADFDFYQGLKEGMLCYVLNSRQMGKSSLRVKTMAKLKREGFACVAFDMTELCVNQVTENEFYSGFVSHLASELNLDIDLQDWWYEHNFIQPCLRLSKFVEEVLLQLPQDIVIFIDEIDSLLNFSFKDDFMAFIRSCYHKRIEKRSLNRLTFALLGTATLEELFQDKNYINDTYFQIQHRAIELTGFQLHEVEPLQTPLIKVAENPSAVMQEILSWTGGQPFFTQWICQLICNSGLQIAQGEEAETVSWILRSRIIENWLLQDKQQHFYTICDRIINNKIPASRLLQLYQQVLHYGNISADDSPEVLQLYLSGLVKE